MSFSLTVKNELARVYPKKDCCLLVELSAIFRLRGTMWFAGQQQALSLTTENAALARKMVRMSNEFFQVPAQVLTGKSQLNKKNVYRVKIPVSEPLNYLHALGILDARRQVRGSMPKILIRRICCQRSYLRGCFLAGGSVNAPGRNYHLEILTTGSEHAKEIQRLARQFDIQLKKGKRRRRYFVYVKDADQIGRFFSVIGAANALLEFENVRVIKEIKGGVNRLVNCETANLNKSVDAAMRQLADIKLIKKAQKWHELTPALRELAELRVAYPDVSLRELGGMLTPQLGKSGVNHRMRRLYEIAKNIRSGTRLNRKI